MKRVELSEGKVISFDYHSPQRGKIESREITIKGYSLMRHEHFGTDEELQCIDGWCHDRKAQRSFPLKFISNMKVLA